MKKFLAIYTGTAAAIEKWKAMDEAKRKEREQSGMKAWGDWMAANKAAVVDQGGPLGKRSVRRRKASLTSRTA